MSGTATVLPIDESKFFFGVCLNVTVNMFSPSKSSMMYTLHDVYYAEQNSMRINQNNGKK